MKPQPIKRKIKRTIEAYAIVWKHDKNEIVEAYDDCDMCDVFFCISAARMYLNRYFTKKQWPNYNKDIKVVPVKLTYYI